jgi:hypothetical protein
VAYIREDQADIRLWVNGVPYGDSWASAEGGNLEADAVKTRPGGMSRQVSAGGPAERDDLTLATQFTDVAAGWVAQLENLVGGGDAVVGISYLLPNKTPSGRGKTIRGTVGAVRTPDMDSNGGDMGFLEVVVNCHE